MSCCVHARAQLATLYRSSSSTRSCVFVALGICVVAEARVEIIGRVLSTPGAVAYSL